MGLLQARPTAAGFDVQWTGVGRFLWYLASAVRLLTGDLPVTCRPIPLRSRIDADLYIPLDGAVEFHETPVVGGRGFFP